MLTKQGFVFFVSVLFLILFGCNNNPTSVDDTVPTDTQQLSELTENEESEYFKIDQVSEDSAYAGNLDTAITPLRWGRKIHTITAQRIVTFDTTNHDTARVQVVWNVSGNLILVLANDTILKPFTDQFIRRGVFVRTGRHTRYRHLNWRLVRVTATEGQTLNRTDVEIASVSWYRKGSSGHTWELIQTINDPLSYWQVRDSLPLYHPNDSIKVEVVMNTSGSYFGQIHFRTRRLPHFHRREMMNFSPTQLVAVEKIPSDAQSTVRHLFVDIMTNATLFDHQAPYSANIWGMLYRVQ